MTTGDLGLLATAGLLVVLAGLFTAADAALGSFSKARAGELVVVDTVDLADAKTGALAKQLANLGWKRALVIDAAVNDNFARAARNIETLDVLPAIGANVYDILRRDTLVLTRAGVEALEARLK